MPEPNPRAADPDKHLQLSPSLAENLIVKRFPRRKNKSYRRELTAWGETKRTSDWMVDPRCKARQRATIYKRIDDLGWSVEDALSRTARAMQPFLTLELTAFGDTMTVREWLEDERCEVDCAILHARVDKGWRIERAMTEPVHEQPTERFIEAFGESKRLAEWARDPRCSVPAETIAGRLDRGWTTEHAIATPPLDAGVKQYSTSEVAQMVTYKGETKPLRDWAVDPRCLVADFTFYARLQRGWPFEDALTLPATEEGAKLGKPIRSHEIVEGLGESKPLKDWAQDPRCIVTEATLLDRVDRGWSLEEALMLPLNDPSRGSRLRSVPVTAWGETKPAVDWPTDPRCVVHTDLLVERIRLGWPAEEALVTPSRDAAHDSLAKSRPLTAWGETRKVVEWVKDPRCAVTKPQLLNRLMRGWPPERALSTPAIPRRHAA